MPKHEPVSLAIIGGSGLYDMEALTKVKEYKIKTPFGDPSDAIVVGSLSGKRVAFLPRHGRGHRLTPTEVNSHANIWALKSMGVERIVSVSACGSLREEYEPRHIVIPSQLFDRTRGRPLTFFGQGLVAHVGLADPFCPELSGLLYEAAKSTGATVHMGGWFVTVEGPRFSTKAESTLFRQWGMDIIGMTAIPEANLAREAEICYACMAHVTDYDVWHSSEEAVNVQMIVERLLANVEVSKQAIAHLAPTIPNRRTCECPTALVNAIITQPQFVPLKTKRDLAPIIGKYMPIAAAKSKPVNKNSRVRKSDKAIQ